MDLNQQSSNHINTIVYNMFENSTNDANTSWIEDYIYVDKVGNNDLDDITTVTKSNVDKNDDDELCISSLFFSLDDKFNPYFDSEKPYFNDDSSFDEIENKSRDIFVTSTVSPISTQPEINRRSVSDDGLSEVSTSSLDLSIYDSQDDINFIEQQITPQRVSALLDTEEKDEAPLVLYQSRKRLRNCMTISDASRRKLQKFTMKSEITRSRLKQFLLNADSTNQESCRVNMFADDHHDFNFLYLN